MSWWVFKKKPKPKHPATEAYLEWIEHMERIQERLEEALKALRGEDEDNEVQVLTDRTGDDEASGIRRG